MYYKYISGVAAKYDTFLKSALIAASGLQAPAALFPEKCAYFLTEGLVLDFKGRENPLPLSIISPCHYTEQALQGPTK